MELAEPTTSATKKGERSIKHPNSWKTAEKPKAEADPSEMNTGREERKERGKDLMEKCTQEQKTSTEHCLRSRPQQRPEEDHIPDVLERQIEERMGQEGITIDVLFQSYRNKMNKGKRKCANHLRGELSKQVAKGHKSEDKGDQEESHSSSSHGRGEKGQCIREGTQQQQKPGEITSPREMTNGKQDRGE